MIDDKKIELCETNASCILKILEHCKKKHIFTSRGDILIIENAIDELKDELNKLKGVK